MIEYDPFAAETLNDPFPAYTELRSKCPMHRFDDFEHPLYTATRHDDVVELLTDVETWSSQYGQMPRFTEEGCLFSDPPSHTWHRALVQQSFAPRHVAAMESEISELVDELVAGMADMGGSADLHDALACPLPVLVIAKILGVPTGDIEKFKAWSDEQVAASGSTQKEAEGARDKLKAYLLGQLNQRRRLLEEAGVDPDTAGPEVLGTVIPDDVTSGFLLAEVEGQRLDDRARLVMLNQLLVGGNETTTSLITNMLWRLLENRELFEQLQGDPSLDVVAVEESLRMDAPVLGLYRTNSRPLVRHGVEVPFRSKVMATFGAANRDPEVFEDPDTFRLDRDPAELRKHLSFGLGHHFCPGAHLSRLEARLALRALVDRFPSLRLDGPPSRIEPFLLWGRRTLPVAWGPFDR